MVGKEKENFAILAQRLFIIWRNFTFLFVPVCDGGLDKDYCCTPNHQCSEGGGDCDIDEDCKEDTESVKLSSSQKLKKKNNIAFFSIK